LARGGFRDATVFACLQWLAVGVFINSLAYVPFSLLQGVGRPDLTATLHLIELPLYLGLLWWLINHARNRGRGHRLEPRRRDDALFLFGLAKSHLPEKARYGCG